MDKDARLTEFLQSCLDIAKQLMENGEWLWDISTDSTDDEDVA